MQYPKEAALDQRPAFLREVIMTAKVKVRFLRQFDVLCRQLFWSQQQGIHLLFAYQHSRANWPCCLYAKADGSRSAQQQRFVHRTSCSSMLR